MQVDGAMESFVVKSNITWLDLRLQVSERLVISATNLNLGYKFTTDARAKAPNRLSTHVQCIEMIQEAREGLAANNASKAKGKANVKPFKVEIINLNAGKDKEKSKQAKQGKRSGKVSHLTIRGIC